MTFLQVLMNQGRFRGGQLLQPKTIALMNQNQIGDIAAGILKTTAPSRSNDVDFFPGIPCRWGLAYMINTQPGPNGRSAGSLTWAGIFNTYYWLDPQKRVAGVYMTQILPFADGPAVQVYGDFEKAIYGTLATA
jgi:methyl acetate hydrolase